MQTFFVIAGVAAALIAMLIVGIVIGTDRHTEDDNQKPSGPLPVQRR
jgi:hypothetical protein